ncbi:phosphatase PAP2 family protein [Nocardioides euryhalodurans]|uniref:Phosphatase PAP2 family protein n=1 Tax=Nocardioides euryhalodurans TaxID=2518370 RepID=A0A4P7GGR8_9ACTN|nr:phosphatase PAP2 family protein [Nocardioides euryhalodurans]QBR91060.1 phosphatase PAP2 family protein [Nocardioides euryhalodurans]
MYVDRSTNGRVRLRWVTGQAALVLLGVAFYFGVRGYTEASRAEAVDHAHDLVALEARLGIDVEHDLQSLAAPSDTVETLANWIYIWGHWPVIIATMVWLGWRHRRQFLRLRDAMLVSGALGMVVFVSYPVAPPRLADARMVDTVTERSEAYRILQPPAFVNQYAALPSLHSGWDLLVGISIVAAASTLALKVVGFAMPVLMGIAVVATANHYVIDVVAGVALVLVGYAAALALERRRDGRHRSPG